MEVSKCFIYMYTVYKSETIAGLDNYNKFSQVTLHLQRVQHIKFTCMYIKGKRVMQSMRFNNIAQQSGNFVAYRVK